MSTFLRIIATGLYTGYLPGAPGTWATVLVGLPLCYGLKLLGETAFIVSTILVILLSVWASAHVEAEMGEEDPGCVVIDEVAGLMVAMAFVPLSAPNLLIACALFRLFDIVKIYPIRMVDQRLGGGWGITIDDVLAGVYANLLLRLIQLFF